MSLSSRNRRLVKQHGRDVRCLPFSKLPSPFRKAIEVYHEGAGAPLPKANHKFGTAVVPMNTLIEEILDDDELSNFATWEAYHAWYISSGSSGHVPTHREQWAVILSNDDGETLQDGWHRLHSYYRDGDENVRVIWYA